MATLKELNAHFATGADGAPIPVNEALPIYVAVKTGRNGRLALKRVATVQKQLATETKAGRVLVEGAAELKKPGVRGSKRHSAIILYPL